MLRHDFMFICLSRGIPYVHLVLGREGPAAPYPSNLHADWKIPDGWNYGHGGYLPNAPPIAPVLVSWPSPNHAERETSIERDSYERPFLILKAASCEYM
jgi:hypothetical protein